MNINFTDLEKLIKIAEHSNINSLEVVDGDKRIHIVCHPHDNKMSDNNDFYATSSQSNRQTASSAEANKKYSENTNSDVDTDKKATTDVEQKNQVIAPMLGTFYRRSEPTADEFVNVGDHVDEGQTLCVIEAMKIMHELKADSACTIKDILVNEGDVVEYAQALFTIETSD